MPIYFVSLVIIERDNYIISTKPCLVLAKKFQEKLVNFGVCPDSECSKGRKYPDTKNSVVLHLCFLASSAHLLKFCSVYVIVFVSSIVSHVFFFNIYFHVLICFPYVFTDWWKFHSFSGTKGWAACHCPVFKIQWW